MKEGAFFGHITLGSRPALLVVDMSIAFTDPGSPLGSPLDDVVEAISRLLEAARGARAPVVYTTVAYADPDENTAAVFLEKVPALRTLRAGSHWVDIDHRIKPRPEELVLTKLFASAFFGTSLVSALTAARVDTVVVAGATTSGCVRASVVDALQYGFRPVIAPEAVGDRDPSAHEANLRDMAAKYAAVLPLEEVVAYLRRSRDPETDIDAI